MENKIINLDVKREKLALENLVDVYIQDPVNNCGYLITAKTLCDNYRTNENVTNGNYITFVIPDSKNLTTAVPVFQQNGDDNCPIRIFDLASKYTFIIPRDDLNLFMVSLSEFNPHGISFVMPIKSELIEELPALMRGLLQSGEHIVVIINGKMGDQIPASTKNK